MAETAQVTEPQTPRADGVAASQGQPTYARTELGRKLREIRRRIVASAQPLVDWHGLEREIAKHRGDETEENA